MGIDLRCGDWRDVLADVDEVDCLITDPPYGARTHKGHRAILNFDAAGNEVPLRDGATRQDLPYASWGEDDVAAFVESWAPRTKGWIAALTSHDLVPSWEDAFGEAGRVAFAPLPCVMRGMTVRMSGDGPSSWSVWLMVARPRGAEHSSWGTLPGAYISGSGRQHTAGAFLGGKPISLMSAIIRDYSKPGNLVCDPCAGGGTTLLAAESLGRRAIGAELDPETYEKAMKRIRQPLQRDLLA